MIKAEMNENVFCGNSHMSHFNAHVTDTLSYRDSANIMEYCLDKETNTQINKLILSIILFIKHKQYKCARTRMRKLKRLLIVMFYNMPHCSYTQYEYLYNMLMHISTLQIQHNIHYCDQTLINICVNILKIQHYIFKSMFPIPSLYSLNVLYDLYVSYFNFIFKIYFDCSNNSKYKNTYINEYIDMHIKQYIKNVDEIYKTSVQQLLHTIEIE